MFIASFPAGPWQTSCDVLTTASRFECVVIDPGPGPLAGARVVVAAERSANPYVQASFLGSAA